MRNNLRVNFLKVLKKSDRNKDYKLIKKKILLSTLYYYIIFKSFYLKNKY